MEPFPPSFLPSSLVLSAVFRRTGAIEKIQWVQFRREGYPFLALTVGTALSLRFRCSSRALPEGQLL